MEPYLCSWTWELLVWEGRQWCRSLFHHCVPSTCTVSISAEPSTHLSQSRLSSTTPCCICMGDGGVALRRPEGNRDVPKWYGWHTEFWGARVTRDQRKWVILWLPLVSLASTIKENRAHFIMYSSLMSIGKCFATTPAHLLFSALCWNRSESRSCRK